jgi:hypothetical protein
LLGGDHQGRPTSRRGTEIRARPPGRALAAWRQTYFFFLAPVFFVDFLVVFFAVFLAAIEMAPPCEASYFFRPLPAPGRQKSKRAAINTCSSLLRQSGHKCRLTAARKLNCDNSTNSSDVSSRRTVRLEKIFRITRALHFFALLGSARAHARSSAQ